MSRPLAPPQGRANTADILLIGAQRAMTTWAHRLAVLHPRTWAFPDFAPLTAFDKEAQFWTRNHARGPDWYRVLMTPPDGRDRLSLDFTPDYATMTDAQIAECKALNPTARVVYILRDPMARALSALRMHTMWDTGNAAPEAILLHHDPETLARAGRARLWAHADYAGNAARWRRAYPDLTVLNAEVLVADPLAGAGTVLRAMGLEPAEVPQSATLAQRARERVWQTPRYAARPDLLAWLHGATWAARRATESEFGFVFREFEGLLDSPAAA